MSNKPMDLTNQKYGRLLVISSADTYINPNGRKIYKWNCVCDCGNKLIVSTNSLRNGSTRSCGCLQKERAHDNNYINLMEMKFGKLTVVEEIHKNKNLYWRCICECGNYTEVLPQHLKRHLIVSCGCYRKSNSARLNYKHGSKNTRLYKTWIDMKDRCYNHSNFAYKNYGQRGICVCEEWINDFLSFQRWSLDNGYQDELSIDRIDVNGNYEPCNCRWVTALEQANNKRNNIRISYDGQIMTIAEWSRYLGIAYQTLYNRIHNLKWDIERAFGTPVL